MIKRITLLGINEKRKYVPIFKEWLRDYVENRSDWNFYVIHYYRWSIVPRNCESHHKNVDDFFSSHNKILISPINKLL